MCQNQDHPRLTVQNITFIDASSKNETEFDGGGAIWVRGGRFKLVNTRFFNNVCADSGPDVGGAAVRVFSQYEGFPVYVVNSTFGGDDGFGNTCSNGGGISSIGVSWTIINSLFSHNNAIGNGGNPAQGGTPGGGSGGAIYNDGNTMTLSICGTRIEHNDVVQHGSAIFFVTNDHSGDIAIDRSVITKQHRRIVVPDIPADLRPRRYANHGHRFDDRVVLLHDVRPALRISARVLLQPPPRAAPQRQRSTVRHPSDGGRIHRGAIWR